MGRLRAIHEVPEKSLVPRSRRKDRTELEILLSPKKCCTDLSHRGSKLFKMSDKIVSTLSLPVNTLLALNLILTV